MQNLIVQYAIPVFFLALLVEWRIGLARGLRVYKLNAMLADLGCGTLQQLTNIVTGTWVVLAYIWGWEHLPGIRFAENSVWPWIIALVGVDFIYYVWHRAGHRVGFIWAMHAVHHQSREMNLAVALRQSALTRLSALPFNLPLVFLGVHPTAATTAVAIVSIYQFWVHTELIGRLPRWFEYVFNTPSHHRAHHGTNPEYIDKNYAGVLILWDRFFGTFEPETARPIYGTLKPFESLNPVWANLEQWDYLIRVFSVVKGVHKKLWIWFAPPETTARYYENALVKPASPAGIGEAFFRVLSADAAVPNVGPLARTTRLNNETLGSSRNRTSNPLQDR